MNFASGVVTGNLIAGDLQGGGQVNLGHFDNAIIVPIPEPATLSLIAVGAMLIARRKRL